MFSRQQLRLLSVLAVFVALTQAIGLESNLLARNEIVKKANPVSSLVSAAGGVVSGLLGGSEADSTSSSVVAPTSSEKVAPKTTSTSTAVSSTPEPSSSTTTSALPSSTPSSIHSSPTSQASSIPVASTSSTPSRSPSETPSSSIAIATLVSTVSGSAITSVSSSTVPPSSSSTNPASLTENQTSSSGMSTKTRNTVIGVVVGVGGAIILAGLFVVAWRIWGRGKNDDDDDGLMGYRNSSSAQEKSTGTAPAGPANPFQSTLENYHNPARQVNASSNF